MPRLVIFYIPKKVIIQLHFADRSAQPRTNCSKIIIGFDWNDAAAVDDRRHHQNYYSYYF